jgi:[protein-PII] uridylyltransferase
MGIAREPFLAKLREAHAAFAPEDARLANEVRNARKMEEDVAAHDGRRSGLEEARDLAAIADAIVRTHLEALDAGPGLTALALGGYGRGERSPYSDIDLMLLVADGVPAASEAAARLVRFLWDVGFSLGHSVRTLGETAEIMRQDVPSATAVLESRRVWGDGVLEDRLRDEVLTPFLEECREGFLRAKIDETLDRHRFYGGSPCIVEPNVKESPGGLRDMHVAQWIARARTGARDFSELRERKAFEPTGLEDVLRAYGTMHRVRHALHRLAGARQDVLDAAVQPRAAEALGHRDGEGRIGAEELMRTVTGAARRIHHFLEEVISFHEEDRSERPRSRQRREVARGFVVVGERLFLARPDVFDGEGSGRRMVRAFLLAQRHRAPVSEEIVIAVRRRRADTGDALRRDPEVIQTFRSLLQGRRAVGRTLRDMHRAELLGELLPEFGDLTGLVRIDGYHRYTVDEHSLRTVEALEDLERDEAHPFLADELRRVLRPDLLRLAALLHDMGKAAGPDHEAAGANRIVDVAARLGFGEGETRILRSLLLHHTLLSETADRRVGEEEEIRLARAVGSAERLRMLFLLNLADVRAVGGNALSGWRLAQIRHLYERVRDRLETLPRTDEESHRFEERLLAEVAPERAEAARLHAGLVPDRYRYEVEPRTAARHLDLITRLEDRAIAAMLLPGRDAGELWIASLDQPARFAQLAGALTASGLDVRAAEAYTRRDRIVLDVFQVVDEDGRPPEDPALADRIEDGLAGPWASADGLARAVRARQGLFRAEDPGPPVPVTVRISDKVSPRHTVVDVVAADRPGLLYDLARGISEAGFDIGFARVATRGRRVADAFYLNGPPDRLRDETALAELRDVLLEAARGE